MKASSVEVLSPKSDRSLSRVEMAHERVSIFLHERRDRESVGWPPGGPESHSSSFDFVTLPIRPPATLPAGLQMKAKVASEDDPLEREAEATADRIMRIDRLSPGMATSPADTIWRSCTACTMGTPCTACERENELARASRPTASSILPASIDAAVRVAEHGGTPLDRDALAFFEPRFGYDFGRIRIHADGEASTAANAIGARAYTHRSHIVFGTAEYAPETERGRRLLAHELVHVIQNRASDRLMRAPADEPGAAEVECPDHLPDRAEEARLSQTSPGSIAFESNPLALSLHGFGIDRAEPKAVHRTALTELASLLNAHGSAEVRIHLVGHTDCTGTTLHNDRLSRRRAREVRDLLAPLVTRRVGMTWASELHPIASNATAEGRSRNRRVDLRFTSVASPQPQDVTPPIVEPPLGGERPPPGGDRPPIIDPPPGGDRGPDDDRDDGPSLPDPCMLAPGLCAGVGLPFLLPLLCVLEPLLCALPILPPILPPVLPPGGPDRPGDPERPDPDPEPDRRPFVSFEPNVRATNTPRGMNDRISPSAPVHIRAVVTNPPRAPHTILIEVDGGGPRTGEALVNGAASITITDTTALEIKGTTMTPANSGRPHLQLGAWFDGDLVGSSNTFAVSVIQQDWETRFESQDEYPSGYDLYVAMHWGHDGAGIYQLAGSEYVELVDVENETGAMRGMGVGRVQDDNDFAIAEIMPNGDTHGTERRWLTGRGTQVLRQLWRTRDTRSGSGWVPSRQSGFIIERRYERDPDRPRCWRLSVEKAGRAVSIGGWSTEAGAGRASAVWRGIDCDPPRPPEPEPPTPIPEPEPPNPIPEPEPPTPTAEPECDADELARRIDACVAEARRSAIACTAGLIRWGNPIVTGGRYYLCLRRMRDRLLECDRESKRDTHCEDVRYAAATVPLPEEPLV